MKKNVLITGGFGLLGQSLVRKLNFSQYKIFILDKKKYKKKNKFLYIFFKNVKILHGDFNDHKFIFNLIKKNNIKIKSGYCLRLHPAVIELKKIIDNNLKNILKININTNSYLPSWRKQNYKNSVSAKKIEGGGVINELSHELDLILYLFGKPKSLYANYLNTNYLKIDTEDVADIIFSMNKKLNLNLHIDFCSLFEKREVEVILKNKKKILLDLNKNCISISNLKKTITKNFNLKKNFYVNAQITEMIKISNNSNKTSWMSELKDAIYVLYIIKQIRISNSKKKLVHIEKEL